MFRRKRSRDLWDRVSFHIPSCEAPFGLLSQPPKFTDDEIEDLLGLVREWTMWSTGGAKRKASLYAKLEAMR